MWLLIFGVTFAALIAAVIYMVIVVSRFPMIKKITKDKRVFRILISLAINVAFMSLLTVLTSFVNATVIYLQLLLFFLLFSFIGWIIKKSLKKESEFYWQGWLSVITCIVYFAIAFFLCKNVWLKEYNLSTEKNVGEIKVAMFADSHVGTTFDGEGFAANMKKIQEQSPDVLLIAGDFVDDSTSRDDMVRACQALGDFKAKYGVWYCFGNHDRGYYRDSESGFTEEDLVAELEKNNVHVLVDDYALIDDRFYIVGREDASADYEEELIGKEHTDDLERSNGQSGDGVMPVKKSGRLSAEELIGRLDPEKYIIVLDHQPSDYENESATAADLVLSGHTHGGQLLPINYVGEWFGINDRTYGFEKRNGTSFIVTSGISAWEIIFKSGTKSEYVIININ